MTDYKTLYFTLFNKVTDLIEELKEIQCQMEEMYVNNDTNGENKKGGIKK